MGSTGIRAILYDRKLNPIQKTYRRCPPVYPQPGWVEYDLEKIWKTVQEVMNSCLCESGVKATSIAGMGLTTQRNVLAFWKRDSGHPVGRALSWQDPRGAEHVAALRGREFDRRFARRLGLTLTTNCAGLKLSWLVKHQKNLDRELKQGRLLAGTLDTWLVYKLSRGRMFITDESSASLIGLFDIQHRRWDPDILEVLGLKGISLAEVLPSAGYFCRVAVDPCGIELDLTALCVDQQVSLLGHGCLRAGQAKCTLGTGSFLLMNLGEEYQTVLPELRTRIAWSWQGKAVYALEGVILHAGSLLDWLLSLGLAASMEEAQNLAMSVESAEGVFLVPALTGLGSPYWAPNARGLISGLTTKTTRAHIWRAAWEAIVLQVWQIWKVMRQRTKLPVIALQVDGGVAINNELLSLLASVLEIEVHRPPSIERTALGIAALASLELGWWSESRGHSTPGSGAYRYLSPSDEQGSKRNSPSGLASGY